MPASHLRLVDFADRAAWDAALAKAVTEHQPDLVVSAGYMRILGPPVTERWRNRWLNVHPALLPSFPGMHAVAQALAYRVKTTGVTVHLVDEGVDAGPVVLQEAVEVRDDHRSRATAARAGTRWGEVPSTTSTRPPVAATWAASS